MEDTARCLVDLVHADKSKARCVLGTDHLKQETDHVDEHGHHAPCLRVSQAIAAAQAPAPVREDVPLLVRRPLDRAEGAALDAIDCIRAARIGDARDLLREALLDLDTAERRQREEAARG